MMQGTISDFDAEAGVGIIESDDGDIVFFNRHNVTFDPQCVSIGLRVVFESHESELGPHADEVCSPAARI
ncbi:MAG TPA: hypothetical protein VIL28_00240, partial [Steroidobacteraceae bacterium]